MEEVAAVPSVSLRPLDGMDAIDVSAVVVRDSAALGALLKLCNGWQKAGATVQGQCVLVSRSRFEVEISYHVGVIGAFKLMPTKNYGNLQPLKLLLCSCLERLLSCGLLRFFFVVLQT